MVFWNGKWPQKWKVGKVPIFTEPLIRARLWTRCVHFAFNPHNTCTKQVVLHLILQMRKLSSREVKRQAQGHTEWCLTKEPIPLLQAPSMPLHALWTCKGVFIWVATNLLRKFYFLPSEIELNYLDPAFPLGHNLLDLCCIRLLGLHCPHWHLLRCLPPGPCLAVILIATGLHWAVLSPQWLIRPERSLPGASPGKALS